MSGLPTIPDIEIGAGKDLLVHYAKTDDINFIIDLSARVQAALTSSGSLQEIGPLAFTVVERSIRGEHAYLLQLDGRRIGNVLVDPLDGIFSNTAKTEYLSWGIQTLPGPFWYLHGLMIEPAEQGNHFGVRFLETVLGLMKKSYRKGSVVLDCWAGNDKLRRFYREVGFQHHGNFPENDYEISVYVFTL